MDLVRSLEWVVIQYDQVLRERGNVDTGTREHGDGRLEAKKKRLVRFSLPAFGGNRPSFISDFWTPEPRGSTFLVRHPVVVHCHSRTNTL